MFVKNKYDMKKEFNISDFSDKLFLNKTDKTFGVSFVTNCSFWETIYDNVYLTDYNLNYSETESIDKANLLKDKEIFTIFYKKEDVFISEQISACFLEAEHIDFIMCCINDLYKRAKLLKFKK